MRKVCTLNSLVLMALVLTAGCQSSDSSNRMNTGGQRTGRYVGFTGADNPTTIAGRGEPNLQDEDRAAAWIYIDGHAGEYIEEDGNPQLQWYVTKSAHSTPKFRVEAYTPLIGVPDTFSCVLRSVSNKGSPLVVYMIASKEGQFQPGREYSLTNPGSDFVIRDGQTRDIISEIPPLPAGEYALAASVKNTKKDVAALAVTYFKVGE